MHLPTTRRVMVSFDLLTFRRRFSVCHNSGTSLAADGVKSAFQAPRLSEYCLVFGVCNHTRNEATSLAAMYW